MSEKGGVNSETISETDKLKASLWKALESSPNRSKTSEEIRKLQKEIVSALPGDLATELKAFYYTTDEGAEERQMRGFLFEEIVAVDPNICPKEESALAKQLRSLMKDPSMYQLPSLKHSVRNPDLVRVNEETGEIREVVEAKAGKLGDRCYRQIKNFDIAMADILDALKASDEETLKEHGLAQIAARQNELRISPDFGITLAVPRESYNDITTNLILESDIHPGTERYENMTNMLSECNIIESPFSRDDLRDMSSCIMTTLTLQANLVQT